MARPGIERLVRDLSVLDDVTLDRIGAALHDLLDRDLHRAILDILWLRASTTWMQKRWPVHNRRIVTFCSRASGPDDPAHRPHSRLDLPNTKGERCSCGACRPNGRAPELLFKRQLVRPDVRVWPIDNIEGVPHYKVCKYAKHAEDVEHCPPEIGVGHFGSECLCGGYLADDVDDFKLLPVSSAVVRRTRR